MFRAMSTSPKDGDSDKRMLEGLDDVRAELDDVDRRIVDALVERDRIVMEVARRKAGKGDGRVRDPVREETQLTRLSGQGQVAGLDGFYVTRVFREVLDHSVRLQQEFLARKKNPDRDPEGLLVVAYQGIDGAYSHLAAMRHFGPRGGDVEFRGYPTFRAMMEAVRDGQARYGLLPIENTTAGSINDAYDLLAQMDLSIVGEEVQKVEHCLVAIEDVPLSRIRRVFSHPQALAQCSNFLAALPDCHVESFLDTAMAVQRVGVEQDLSQAAIASEEAARRYGLTVIKRDIANQKENFTRMVVIAAQPEAVDPRVACKTSLILATKHEKGALLGCLNALAERDLNLTKLESRPRPHTPWEYLFYVDFEGNLDHQSVAEALSELRTKTSYLRVLGSYPARNTRDARPAEARAQLSPPEGLPEGALPKRGSIVPRELDQSRHRLSVRAEHPEDTQIEVGAVRIGGSEAVVIARVMDYATREGLLDCARAVRAAGASLLWAPCFDARIRERGDALGRDPLELLEEVGRIAGLPIVAEVLHPSDVDRAVERADVLCVGAAQMENMALLREVGRVDRPVILERGMMASVDEWLGAAEFVLARGNHRVILCERGIRTFERNTPTTLDLSAVAALRERSHLPIFVDPSQATGRARWAMALAEAARATGAHGAVVEVVADLPALERSLSIAELTTLVLRLGQARAC
jgi:chorismate mutase / prephenate dehydratase